MGITRDWKACPKMCSDVIFNRFVVFKTPYKYKFEGDENIEESFDVTDVFEMCEKNGMELGLWIDLTFTTRYFNNDDVTKRNCEYVKIACAGQTSSDINGMLGNFYDACNRFLYKRTGKLIGVHCYHGFNRTGFAIVSYMVDVCGWDVRAAVQEFANLRPPGIYKKHHLNELSRKYKVKLKVPPLPMWAKQRK